MSDTSPNPAPQPPPGAPSVPSGLVPTPPPMPAPSAYPAMPAPGIPASALAGSSTRGMYTAAAILNWVTLAIVIVGSGGFGIIAAAWFIPMTILIHKAAKGPYKHTALGVCTLLFCNLISGILMLVDDSNRAARPVA